MYVVDRAPPRPAEELVGFFVGLFVGFVSCRSSVEVLIVVAFAVSGCGGCGGCPPSSGPELVLGGVGTM